MGLRNVCGMMLPATMRFTHSGLHLLPAQPALGKVWHQAALATAMGPRRSNGQCERAADGLPPVLQE